uniref:Ribonuclease H-like domain-containing protein n=1 Tax=Syphacia muris TaxID=451379 RepID=A0A0N5AX97_9BILA
MQTSKGEELAAEDKLHKKLMTDEGMLEKTVEAQDLLTKIESQIEALSEEEPKKISWKAMKQLSQYKVDVSECEWNTEKLREFLRKQISYLQAVHRSKRLGTENRVVNKNRSVKKDGSKVNNIKKICIFCDGGHSSDDCHKYTDVDERMKLTSEASDQEQFHTESDVMEMQIPVDERPTSICAKVKFAPQKSTELTYQKTIVTIETDYGKVSLS